MIEYVALRIGALVAVAVIGLAIALGLLARRSSDERLLTASENSILGGIVLALLVGAVAVWCNV